MRNSKSPLHIHPLTIADFERLFPDDDACRPCENLPVKIGIIAFLSCGTLPQNVEFVFVHGFSDQNSHY